MSAENITRRDSLDSAFVAKSESDENIQNVKDMTIDCAKKFVNLCCHIREMDNLGSSDKYELLKNKMDIIIRMEELLDSYFLEISYSQDPKLDEFIVLAESFKSMCSIKLPSNTTEQEHLYIARFFIMQSLTLLKDKELNSRVILTAMSSLNLVSYICIKLRNEPLSLQYLNKALDLYITYTKEQDDFPTPIDILNLICLATKRNTVYLLNEQFMNTLKFLIILSYNKHLAIDMEKITTYMHKLLKKQLADIPQSIDYVSWSMEAVRLAEYFSLNDRFVECKNHLGFASVIITKFYNNCCKINAGTSAEKNKTLYCQYKSTVSIIDTCWVKYGLALLFSSRKQLLNREGQDNIMEINRCKSKSTTPSVNQSMELLVFPCTEKKYKEFIHITEENYITHFDEAKGIFVNILQLLNKIKVDKFVSEDIEVRVEIAQYISRAYKYLAFYVHDKVSQIKLQKRRIDVLEDCLTSFGKDDIMRLIIWFELALINSTILNVKFESMEKDKLSDKELVEINELVEKNRIYLQFYSDNYKILEYAQMTKLIDESHQVISTLNVNYFLRK